MSAREYLKILKSGGKAEVLNALAILDSKGFFIKPYESVPDFCTRVSMLLDRLDMLDSGDPNLATLLSGASRIPSTLIDEASDLTWNIYKFRAEWVPARVSAKRCGAISEGILYEVDGMLPMIFLKSGNRKNSSAILAHEMCHAVKVPFPESAYCEYFPRRVEFRALRLLFGNFFRKWNIPFAIFGSACLSAVLIALNRICFGIIALIPAIAAIICEFRIMRILNRARFNLERMGCEALPLLFRMSDREISGFAKSNNPESWLRKMLETSPRWEMYADIFCPNLKKPS